MSEAGDQKATDAQFPLDDARAAIAEACLEEAEAALARDRAMALAELRRIAQEFAETPAGERARARVAEETGA